MPMAVIKTAQAMRHNLFILPSKTYFKLDSLMPKPNRGTPLICIIGLLSHRNIEEISSTDGSSNR
jgi:hypothetical protein